MKKRTWYSAVWIGVVCLVAVSSSAGGGRLQPAVIDYESSPNAQQQGLEGTWRTKVTLRICESGAALGTPFPAMISFARGGTLTTAESGFNPALRSPGHGAWRHAGGRTYTAVVEAFLFDPTGAWSGTQRLRQLISLGEGGSEFTATVSAEVFDRHGNQILKACATTMGERME